MRTAPIASVGLFASDSSIAFVLRGALDFLLQITYFMDVRARPCLLHWNELSASSKELNLRINNF